MACSLHCRGVPLNPRDRNPYICFLTPVLRSRITARSGIRAINTNRVAPVR